MRRPLTLVALLALCALLVTPAAAFAQVDDSPSLLDEAEPDPGDDAEREEPYVRDPLLDRPIPAKKKTGIAPNTRDLPAVTPPRRGEEDPSTVPAAARAGDKAGAEKKDDGKKEEAKQGEAQAVPAVAKAAVPAILIPAASDADLLESWSSWRKASADFKRSDAEAAQKALLAAKEELLISDLEPFSIAAARAAQKRLEANDPVAGIELAAAAVELSPNLPYARFAMARTYFASDPTDLTRWGGELKETVKALWRDPRYLRPAAFDLATAFGAALLATAVAVIFVTFVRRSRYFLHDFHHLFPRAAARWQTLPLALLLLSLPIVFRLGLIPVLLTLLLSVTLYLSTKERIVAAALIALVGLLPAFGEAVTDATVFPGTVAEDLYELERGGVDAAAAAKDVRARVASGSASYTELFALGRYEARRGRLDQAGEIFKKAALENGTDARLMVNLGNVRFGLGDLEGASTLYARAGEVDPTLAAAFYNLSRVHYRKAAALGDALQAQELEKAQTTHSLAQQLDPAILARAEPPADQPVSLHRLLISPALSWDDLRPHAQLPEAGERVAGQLSWRLIGMAPSLLALLLPAVLAALVVAFGMLRFAVSASRVCDKCGRAVCRRCDPELGIGSGLCGQCVNVFTRKGVVAPQVKVRKQIEVDRYQTRSDRLSWLFGIVCSGAGHLFAGFPLRGALFSFAFLFLVSSAVFRDGVMRAPYGELPMLFRLVPAGVALVVVYLLSLRSLRKAQAE